MEAAVMQVFLIMVVLGGVLSHNPLTERRKDDEGKGFLPILLLDPHERNLNQCPEVFYETTVTVSLKNADECSQRDIDELGRAINENYDKALLSLKFLRSSSTRICPASRIRHGKKDNLRKKKKKSSKKRRRRRPHRKKQSKKTNKIRRRSRAEPKRRKRPKRRSNFLRPNSCHEMRRRHRRARCGKRLRCGSSRRTKCCGKTISRQICQCKQGGKITCRKNPICQRCRKEVNGKKRTRRKRPRKTPKGRRRKRKRPRKVRKSVRRKPKKLTRRKRNKRRSRQQKTKKKKKLRKNRSKKKKPRKKRYKKKPRKKRSKKKKPRKKRSKKKPRKKRSKKKKKKPRNRVSYWTRSLEHIQAANHTLLSIDREHRILRWDRFSYRGTGRCRFCYGDNGDNRQLSMRMDEIHNRKLQLPSDFGGIMGQKIQPFISLMEQAAETNLRVLVFQELRPGHCMRTGSRNKINVNTEVIDRPKSLGC